MRPSWRRCSRTVALTRRFSQKITPSSGGSVVATTSASCQLSMNITASIASSVSAWRPSVSAQSENMSRSRLVSPATLVISSPLRLSRWKASDRRCSCANSSTRKRQVMRCPSFALV